MDVKKCFVKVFKVTFFKSKSEFEHMDPDPDPATPFLGIHTAASHYLLVV
jgi:hypothetical protein